MGSHYARDPSNHDHDRSPDEDTCTTTMTMGTMTTMTTPDDHDRHTTPCICGSRVTINSEFGSIPIVARSGDSERNVDTVLRLCTV